MKIRLMLALALLLISISPAMTPAARAQDSEPVTLTVFAAASLTDAFTEIGAAFTQANPQVTVEFNFGGSSTLAAQLAEGAPADVFASANIAQMDNALQAGRIGRTPRIFVNNRLVVIVPADNPAGIDSLDDLAQPGILLVLAAPEVPVRAYTDTMLDLLAAELGGDFREDVLNNVVSEEDNVRQVAAKVALGEADAGVVYTSDVTPDLAEDVLTIAVPDEYNTIAEYPIAVTDDSPNPDMAAAFIAFVLSEQGQATLGDWGFVRIDECTVTAR